jgi:hypothetical protein
MKASLNAHRLRHACTLLAALMSAEGAWANGASIFPDGPSVPANLLRIELRLDRPLTDPLDMQHVHLLDTQGREIDGAFLGLALADRDARGITLLLHPGRIKTGLGANLALGPALHAGEVVTLQIDDPQLARPLRKQWQVTPARRQRIDLQAWTLHAPATGGLEALELKFPAALSWSAQDMIAIADAQGQGLVGAAHLSDDALSWRFVPQRPWRPGSYVLHIHPALEDLAGNRVCAPFEERALRRAACAADGLREFTVAPVHR